MTYHGSASTPADAGANAGPNATITPPASMVAGDLAVVLVQYRGNVLFSISTTGGQAWLSIMEGTSGNVSYRLWYCFFNGTWAADPVFTNIVGTAALTGVMHVFRPTAGYRFALSDPALVLATNYAAPSTPFDVTTTALVTTNIRFVVLNLFTSDDDNTWAIQTATWTNAGTAQYRNTTGQDQSNSSAYKFFTAAGTVAAMTNRQATLGGDPGVILQSGFYELSKTLRSFGALID